MRCVYQTFRQLPMARLLLMKAHWLHKTFSMVGSLLKLMKMWETQHRTRKPRLTLAPPRTFRLANTSQARSRTQSVARSSSKS